MLQRIITILSRIGHWRGTRHFHERSKRRRIGTDRDNSGNNFIVQETTLFFVHNGSVSIALFFRLLSIFLNLVRL